MGYRVIRIPYFVQISTQTIKELFNIDFDFPQTFPHGFISNTVIMPADFSEMGIDKFRDDLVKFNFIKSDIINSLRDKAETLRDIEIVLPPSLQNLLDR